MPTVDFPTEVRVDVQVWCSCGQGLCRQSEVEEKNGEIHVTVEPCEKCLKAERDSGYDEGHQDGVDSVKE